MPAPPNSPPPPPIPPGNNSLGPFHFPSRACTLESVLTLFARRAQQLGLREKGVKEGSKRKRFEMFGSAQPTRVLHNRSLLEGRCRKHQSPINEETSSVIPTDSSQSECGAEPWLPQQYQHGDRSRCSESLRSAAKREALKSEARPS